MMPNAPGLRAATVLLALVTGGTAESIADEGNGKLPSCEASSTGGDQRTIRCTVAPAAAGQRLRFQAHFSGGHDDTSASLAAVLDGQPVACSPGSKTSLFGEDGDVSLHCEFSTPAEVRRPQLLVVDVTWRHAQYVNHELRVD